MISIYSYNTCAESQIIFGYDINFFSLTLHCYSISLILFLFRYICASYYIVFFLRPYFLNISNLFLAPRVSPFFSSSNSHQCKISAQLAPRSTNPTLEIPRGGLYQQIAVQFQFQATVCVGAWKAANYHRFARKLVQHGARPPMEKHVFDRRSRGTNSRMVEGGPARPVIIWPAICVVDEVASLPLMASIRVSTT